jgi:hypothetical protein
MAGLLNKEGYSLREIAKFLGFRSPRSVQLCLIRYEKESAGEPEGKDMIETERG